MLLFWPNPQTSIRCTTKKIHIEYQFRGGKDLPMDKLEKAVNLSQERYCGVSFMLGKASEITSEIKILD